MCLQNVLREEDMTKRRKQKEKKPTSQFREAHLELGHGTDNRVVLQ